MYHPFFLITQHNNREVVYNPLVLENGQFRMDMERLWMQAYLRHKNDKRLLTRLGFRMNPKRIKEIFEFDVI